MLLPPTEFCRDTTEFAEPFEVSEPLWVACKDGRVGSPESPPIGGGDGAGGCTASQLSVLDMQRECAKGMIESTKHYRWDHDVTYVVSTP